jgi:amino acid adenylation domain-containing protein
VTTTELLTHLRKLNVTMSRDNDQLILRGPKGALTADLRAELKERKAEILNFLKNTAYGQTPPDSSLPRISRDKNLPLSFAQQRLWFLDQLEPGSTVYNVPGALRIGGPLSVEVLERCFNEIVRRHEALRTTFSTVEEEPVQVIAASTNVSLPVIDISDFSESEREEEARRLALEEANKPFDLRQGPLFRTALIRLGENDHVLLLSLHHIVSDGWSMGVLYRELSALYQAFANEEPSPLPDLPIQYADFAAWQREWLQGEVLESQLSYWKKQLAGAAAVLNLSTDRPRPARQSYRGARQSIELSSELTQGLKALSRKEGVTLYMTLLAAFQILLHRYTGQDDIVVGSPIANRNRIEIEGLIGFFVNTLVLRSDHSGNPTFRELLPRVRETALEAYAHQDLPFEKLVEELRPDRDLSRSPLFQVMFVLQNAPAGELNSKGLNVSPMRMAGETTKFDLTLSVHEGGPGLRAGLQYSTDLFDEATIARMLGHFETLLEGIVANPEQRISDLPILTEAEKHQVLVEWNETKRDYPKDKCIHQLFEEQVKRTPEAVAVVSEDRQLTYGELNRRANQLANYLKKLGVGPEVLVGICVERSLEMIVGLLGILKAGGAYVPLDPKYSKEHLAYILEDARASVLITQQRLVEDVASSSERVMCLDQDWQQIDKENGENLENRTAPENLAYVIYTSGSTGKAKGVAIQHASVVAFLTWTSTFFSRTEMAGVLASTSICFDLSVFEIFGTLSYGGRVVLAQNALALSALPAAVQVSLVNTVPSAIVELLRTSAIPSSVCTINLAGEPLKPALVKKIYQSTSATKVYDLYGPSEDTTYSTAALRTPDGPQTIGKPLANAHIYILDQAMQALPIGVAGDLYIGGVGLARGYLKRPDLTAEKFIPHPFSSERGARLYRTGDLARYLPDGSLEFLGRIDHQVKIRGFRIELGEIEAVLGGHPQVREALVLALEDARETQSVELTANKRLVAYFAAEKDLGVEELRSYVGAKLPHYMVPSAFVRLQALPLTANGKIDRATLPAPDGSRPDLAKVYVEPQTPTEALLVKVWSDVLKLEKIGIHDNFFELGGHSLLATQVVSRMSRALGKNIPLRNLFEAPTVSEIALLVAKSEERSETSHAPPIVRVPRESYRVKIEK